MRIELRELVLERPGGIRAIDGLTCRFDTACCPAVAILGANGAGKSTLLESIPGLVPIASGTILVDAMAVEKRNLTAIRAKVGMIFQNSDDQLFSHTVGEDVAFGPRNLILAPELVQERVRDALQQMGITSLAGRDVARLSGGEKRRAALAGVLAMQPEAILLDEPTSMLDPRACRELAECLMAVPALKLIATHELAFAARGCPECLILKNGRTAARGETAVLLQQHDLLEECGLE